MATAYENLVKHLKLAIRQLEQFTTRFLHRRGRAARTGRHDQCFIPDLDRKLGIPGFMKGSEVVRQRVAALRGIVNTTAAIMVVHIKHSP